MSVTEKKWMACTTPAFLLGFVRERLGERKVRLFTCACCQRVSHLLKDERGRRALECAERLAEGGAAGRRGRQAVEKDARAAAEECRRVADATTDPAGSLAAQAECCAAWAAYFAVLADAVRAADQASVHASLAAAYASCDPPPVRTPFPPDRDRRMREEMREQIRLLREIAGNPFRPVPALAPSWLAWNDGSIPNLARAIYTERAFDRLPVLADALDDAGCTDPEILGHSRSGGEHVRGCWLLDLILVPG